MSYYNGKRYTFTWENGRRLETATVDGVTLTFTYNADGIRTSKTVGGSEHIYHLNGTQIITETWTQGQEVNIYLYDAEGSPIGMKYRGGNMAVGEFEEYWFEKNLQGDIVAVYDAAGNKHISYTYDAWGNFSTTYYDAYSTTSHANLNPFRYRGYYYDSETGLYYVSSRYYDPEIGRWINADGQISGIGGDIVGNNMFAYCMNNPVNMSDPSGNWPRWITAAVTVVAAVVTVAAAATGNFAVAAVAAKVTIAAGATYLAQSAHYDVREARNDVDTLPQSPSDATDADWISSENGGPAADCHQYTATNGPNIKFVSPDGHREVIYNSANDIVLDPRDIGTYNFCPSDELWYSNKSIGHLFHDIIPWVIFGNSDDDPGPVLNEIIRLFE